MFELNNKCIFGKILSKYALLNVDVGVQKRYLILQCEYHSTFWHFSRKQLSMITRVDQVINDMMKIKIRKVKP